MAYVCLNCWQVYDNSIENIKIKTYTLGGDGETIICPKSDCAAGEIVDIDELFLPIIKLLNQKGYITKYCCSGHVYSNIPDTYIVFKESVKVLPNIPEEFDVENDGVIKISYRYSDGVSELELYNSIIENAKKLLKWAAELPRSVYCNV